MPPEVLAAFNLAAPGVAPLDLGLRLVSAFVLSVLMALAYRKSAGELYEPDIAQAQILMGCIMALVLMVVGDSVSRAFGAVGILSVIRFRSNVTNSADAATLLASVAVGMACGVGMFLVAAVGAVFLSAVQAVLRRVFASQDSPGKKGRGKKNKKKNKQKAEATAVVPETDAPPPVVEAT
jgi:hypothetical protein